MRFSIATFVTDETMAPGPLAAAVEERGFHALMVAEHSHMPVVHEPPYLGAPEPGREFFRTLDPFVALASAAAATRTLTLTTAVILLPQRDVIFTAKEVATLDLVSDGRVVVGIGIGWSRNEMRHHGLDPSTRGFTVTTLTLHRSCRGPSQFSGRTRRFTSAEPARPRCGGSAPWVTAGFHTPCRRRPTTSFARESGWPPTGAPMSQSPSAAPGGTNEN
jgi:alkanesulfonate monooxygenase SsuD/methylene tetrahydromethanopterin reductase-like flavin-dependent oxidoreductase (luciferase family)